MTDLHKSICYMGDAMNKHEDTLEISIVARTQGRQVDRAEEPVPGPLRG